MIVHVIGYPGSGADKLLCNLEQAGHAVVRRGNNGTASQSTTATTTYVEGLPPKHVRGSGAVYVFCDVDAKTAVTNGAADETTARIDAKTQWSFVFSLAAQGVRVCVV